jgi:hypothetical protein
MTQNNPYLYVFYVKSQPPRKTYLSRDIRRPGLELLPVTQKLFHDGGHGFIALLRLVPQKIRERLLETENHGRRLRSKPFLAPFGFNHVMNYPYIDMYIRAQEKSLQRVVSVYTNQLIRLFFRIKSLKESLCYSRKSGQSHDVTSGMKKWRGTYVKLPVEAANALISLQKETGKSKTKIIADCLTGDRQFRPDVERWLRDEAEKRRVSRQTMVEIFVSEAMTMAVKNHKPSGK